MYIGLLMKHEYYIISIRVKFMLWLDAWNDFWPMKMKCLDLQQCKQIIQNTIKFDASVKMFSERGSFWAPKMLTLKLSLRLVLSYFLRLLSNITLKYHTFKWCAKSVMSQSIRILVFNMQKYEQCLRAMVERIMTV